MRRLKALIPVLIATGYFLIFGRYGFSDTDDGFITGFVWRVFNGATPYKDFIYVRPPVTLYFHLFFMHLFPLNTYILAERALCCLTILAYSFISAVTLSRIFPEDRNLRDYRWVYTSLFFVFSAHNFAPFFAWHTIDGVLFAAFGAYFLLRDGKHPVACDALAAILLMASALSKQSFYLLPVAGLAYLLVARRGIWNFVVYLAACISSAALLVWWLFRVHAWHEFLQQTSGATHLHDLLHAGINVYYFYGASFLGSCILVYGFFFATASLLPDVHTWWERHNGWIMTGSFLTTFAIIELRLIAQSFRHSEGNWILQTTLGYSQAFMLISLLFLVAEYKRSPLRAASFSFLLLIAWSASISWGYTAPLFYSAPLLYGSIGFAASRAGDQPPRHNLAKLSLATGIAVFSLCNLFPYNNIDLRWHDNIGLSSLSPRLYGIKSGTRTAAKLSEFIELQHKYGSAFITLPAFTTSHFLTGTANPTRFDWAFNVETAFRSEELVSELSKKDVYALVDSREIAELNAVRDADRKFLSDASAKVVSSWTLIESREWYRVYASPEYIERHGAQLSIPQASSAPQTRR